MESLSYFSESGIWFWLSVAVLLLVLELLTGTLYLLWIALAGFITTIIVALIPGLPIAVEIIIFSIIAVASVITGRKLFPNAGKKFKGDLNNPDSRLIGETVIAIEDFSGDVGAVKHGDTRWRAIAHGTIPKSGDVLKILKVDGATLIVGVA